MQCLGAQYRFEKQIVKIGPIGCLAVRLRMRLSGISERHITAKRRAGMGDYAQTNRRVIRDIAFVGGPHPARDGYGLKGFLRRDHRGVPRCDRSDVHRSSAAQLEATGSILPLAKIGGAPRARFEAVNSKFRRAARATGRNSPATMPPRSCSI